MCFSDSQKLKCIYISKEISFHISEHDNYLTVICLILFAIKLKYFTPQFYFLIVRTCAKTATKELSNFNKLESLITYL